MLVDSAVTLIISETFTMSEDDGNFMQLRISLAAKAKQQIAPRSWL